MRKRSQAAIPNRRSPEVVIRALSAIDRAVTRGRRNYAILLLLARLGLRAGEMPDTRLRGI